MVRHWQVVLCMCFLVVVPYIRSSVKRGLSLSGIWRDDLGYTMKGVQKSDAAHWQGIQYSTYSTRVLRGVNAPGRGNLVTSLSAQIFFLVRVLLLIISPQKTFYLFLCA